MTAIDERKDWLFNQRLNGTLDEWDIYNAIDETKNFDELKELLKFLVVEDMIKTWKGSDNV